MMQQDAASSQRFEDTREVCVSHGIRFDTEKVLLQGLYSDELSAYRAKYGWTEALETTFLLDAGRDFVLTVRGRSEEGDFALFCEFPSACGRYAFWRLTNNQSPEAQYLIETAHIPNSERNYASLLRAPELQSMADESLIEQALRGTPAPWNRWWTRWLSWWRKSDSLEW